MENILIVVDANPHFTLISCLSITFPSIFNNDIFGEHINAVFLLLNIENDKSRKRFLNYMFFVT